MKLIMFVNTKIPLHHSEILLLSAAPMGFGSAESYDCRRSIRVS